MQFIAVPSLLLSKLYRINVIWIHRGYVRAPKAPHVGNGSGIPTRRTAALSGAAPRPDTAAAGLPPTPDPAIRMLQKSLQGYCRHLPWGDLYELG